MRILFLTPQFPYPAHKGTTLRTYNIIAGLAPILWSHGTGADVMKRIATPMIGGVVTSTLLELLVYPAIFYLWRARGLRSRRAPPESPAPVPVV